VKTEEEFVEEFRPLVASIAYKVRDQFDLNSDFDDLLAAGMAGLVEARRRFDPERGVQFNTFAYYRIRGAIIDEVRRSARVSRRAHALMKAAEAGDTIAEQVGESRSALPDAAKKESAAAALQDTLGKLTAAYVISAVGPDEDAETSPEEDLLAEEQKARVREYIQHLPEREQKLIVGFYFEGRRFDHVAEELGISKSWASRLHSKALAQLKKALEAA